MSGKGLSGVPRGGWKYELQRRGYPYFSDKLQKNTKNEMPGMSSPAQEIHPYLQGERDKRDHSLQPWGLIFSLPPHFDLLCIKLKSQSQSDKH